MTNVMKYVNESPLEQNFFNLKNGSIDENDELYNIWIHIDNKIRKIFNTLQPTVNTEYSKGHIN